jgi:hypothetical protein
MNYKQKESLVANKINLLSHKEKINLLTVLEQTHNVVLTELEVGEVESTSFDFGSLSDDAIDFIIKKINDK